MGDAVQSIQGRSHTVSCDENIAEICRVAIDRLLLVISYAYVAAITGANSDGHGDSMISDFLFRNAESQTVVFSPAEIDHV